MKIVEKMAKKAKDNWNEPGVTIAFLGDSVTQGCFELYRKGEDGFETYFDKNGAYHLYLSKILSVPLPMSLLTTSPAATHFLGEYVRDS